MKYLCDECLKWYKRYQMEQVGDYSFCQECVKRRDGIGEELRVGATSARTVYCPECGGFKARVYNPSKSVIICSDCLEDKRIV